VSDIVSIALISASSAIVAPALLSYLNGRQMKAKEIRDYARQDEVSARVEALRIEAAQHARATVQAVNVMADNVDKVEKATNSMMAQATKIALDKANEDRARAYADGLAAGLAKKDG
jgi:adenylate kinase